MHIPDGFLNTNVLLPSWLLSLGGLSLALRKTKQIFKDKVVPLMGVMAAFIFAAQMLNFPVIGGTSGHLLGGVLAAIILGPYAGAIVITTVLIVQCFIFQDGGVIALGANIFNMAIVGVFSGFMIYTFLTRFLKSDSGFFLSAFLASLLSVVLAASFCAIELAISGTVPLKITLSAMAGVHALIGIGEGAITVLVLGFIKKVRPDLILNETTT
jgi:cobalt/nickel transport system permease protein